MAGLQSTPPGADLPLKTVYGPIPGHDKKAARHGI
jgi:hypothetical protein